MFQIKEEDESKASSRTSIDRLRDEVVVIAKREANEIETVEVHYDGEITESSETSDASSKSSYGRKISDSLNNNELSSDIVKERITRK